MTTILAAAMKQISWEQVANIAMRYVPDLIARLKEQLQARPADDGEAGPSMEQLAERVRELEGAVIRQEEIIEQQNRNIQLLEEIGRTLQARLNLFMALSALSIVASAVLIVLVLRK